jgi:hypothetical protein
MQRKAVRAKNPGGLFVWWWLRWSVSAAGLH